MGTLADLYTQTMAQQQRMAAQAVPGIPNPTDAMRAQAPMQGVPQRVPRAAPVDMRAGQPVTGLSPPAQRVMPTAAPQTMNFPQQAEGMRAAAPAQGVPQRVPVTVRPDVPRPAWNGLDTDVGKMARSIGKSAGNGAAKVGQGAIKSLTAGAGRLAVPLALGATAAQVAGTDTQEYANRMGTTAGDSLGKDLALRSVGALADLGDVTTLGLATRTGNWLAGNGFNPNNPDGTTPSQSAPVAPVAAPKTPPKAPASPAAPVAAAPAVSVPPAVSGAPAASGTPKATGPIAKLSQAPKAPAIAPAPAVGATPPAEPNPMQAAGAAFMTVGDQAGTGQVHMQDGSILSGPAARALIDAQYAWDQSHPEPAAPVEVIKGLNKQVAVPELGYGTMTPEAYYPAMANGGMAPVTAAMTKGMIASLAPDDTKAKNALELEALKSAGNAQQAAISAGPGHGRNAIDKEQGAALVAAQKAYVDAKTPEEKRAAEETLRALHGGTQQAGYDKIQTGTDANGAPVYELFNKATGVIGQANAQAALPPGLVVGAPTKQADGVYPVAGRKVTIQNGKVTEIK